MVGSNQVKPSPGVGARVIPVRRAIIHPRYRGWPYSENDVMVLILNTASAVAPVPLATTDQLRETSEVELVGFGFNDPERPLGFGVKRQVSVPMGPIRLSPEDNLGELPGTLAFHDEYEFVAGRKGLGRDTCNGDSGGPCYVWTGSAYVLAGLTSRATREAEANCGDGGIYVRPDRFRDWINEVLTAAGIAALS
jgi:endonuclease G